MLPDMSTTSEDPGSTTTSWPRRPRRLATALVEDLVDRIVGGEPPEGATLPIEPVLCETFGVSRTVVREAVKTLETMRLVRVQQGQGTTVRPLADWDLLNPLVLAAVVRHDAENAILEDLVDVRRALEAQMAGQAATRATADQQALIVERMAALDAAIPDAAEYLRADVAFHDSILAASGNRLGRAMIHNLTVEAYRSLRYVGDPDERELHISNEAHHAICDAVLSGDGDEAQRLMDAHILEAWHRRRPQPERRRLHP